MKSIPVYIKLSSGRLTRTLLFVLLLGIAACTPQATSTVFVPPTAAQVFATAADSTTAKSSPTSTATVVPTSTTAPAISPTPCTNNLSFVEDVTIPDGTSIAPGTSIDKQWLVTNSGTCNWDSAYRLKLIAGDGMGAPAEQALYPARAGTQATVRIVLTAPQSTGTYESAWQAFAPDGTAFGEAVYIDINIQ